MLTAVMRNNCSGVIRKGVILLNLLVRTRKEPMMNFVKLRGNRNAQKIDQQRQDVKLLNSIIFLWIVIVEFKILIAMPSV